MLKQLRAMFSRPEAATPAADLLPISIAALLVEAARADETYSDQEKALIDAALARQFALNDADAGALRVEAERAQAEAADLHRFTKVAKTMPAVDKVRLIERLWEIVLSDARRDPHEDALIRRICGLIYVSDPESGAARRRAEQTLTATKA